WSLPVWGAGAFDGVHGGRDLLGGAKVWGVGGLNRRAHPDVFRRSPLLIAALGNLSNQSKANPGTHHFRTGLWAAHLQDFREHPPGEGEGIPSTAQEVSHLRGEVEPPVGG